MRTILFDGSSTLVASPESNQLGAARWLVKPVGGAEVVKVITQAPPSA